LDHKLEEEGQTAYELMVDQQVVSFRGPQGRLQLWISCESKADHDKGDAAFSWLTGLTKTHIVSQQTTCPIAWQPWLLMGLGP